MTLKAIETLYKGYRFRSRLEARWAVFFDAVGAKFEYENQGYELPSGRYLPDFWLPEEKAFIEIKPAPQPPLDAQPLPRELQLAGELMVMSGFSVYVLYGDPVDCLAPDYPGLTGYRSHSDDGLGLTFLYLHDYRSAAVAARRARFEHGQSQ